MEQQDERSRHADGVVKMRQGEAAIRDLAVDPFRNGLERRQRAPGAKALDRLASEKRRRIADRPDKTEQITIVFEPPMRKSSEAQGVVDDRGEEKENPVPPVRERLTERGSRFLKRALRGHRKSSSQASSNSSSASGSQPPITSAW